MIVSMAIAVLPVCRSPMISSRWPRPIGGDRVDRLDAGLQRLVHLLALHHGRRLQLERAQLGVLDRALAVQRLAERVRPPGRGSRRRPARTAPRRCGLTRWPSSILLKSPRMTTPISRTSRLSARPRVPSSNSSSSLAMAEGRPSTRAMPSPHSATVPTSSVAAASGSYASTNSRQRVPDLVGPDCQLRHCPRVSLVLVIASVGFRLGWQPAQAASLRRSAGQAARDAAVDQLVRRSGPTCRR